MKKSYYNITLDIKGIQSQAVLRVKQFDTSRVIYMSLTDGGKPYTIGEKCYAVFEAIKPDGTKVGNNCYIEKNKIVYEITEQTVAVSGIANCEVSLYDADGGLITSPRFTLIIDRKLVTGDEFTSSSEYTSLVECLIRAEASEKEREDAEDERRDTWNTVLDSPKVWELKGGCIYRVSGFVAIDNEGVGFYVADKSLLVVNKDGDKTLFYLYLGGYGDFPYDIIIGATDGTTADWYGVESERKKVYEINNKSTHEGYPSALAVYKFAKKLVEDIPLNEYEAIKNKVTTIGENSTDEQYPTAKAVYDLFGNIEIVGGFEDVDKIKNSIGNTTYIKDITDTFTLSNGYYNKTNGVFASIANAKGTEIFPVTVGEKFYVTGAYGYFASLIVAFDENNTYLPDKSVFSSENANTNVDDYEYIVPEGVAYIGCSTRLAGTSAASKNLIVKKEFTELNNVQELVRETAQEVADSVSYDVVNVCPNGNFENTLNWAAQNTGTNLSIADNVATLTNIPDTSVGRLGILQNLDKDILPQVENSVWFISAKIKVPKETLKIQLNLNSVDGYEFLYVNTDVKISDDFITIYGVKRFTQSSASSATLAISADFSKTLYPDFSCQIKAVTIIKDIDNSYTDEEIKNIYSAILEQNGGYIDGTVNVAGVSGTLKNLGYGYANESIVTKNKVVTVGANGDFPTINSALRYLSKFYPAYLDGGIECEVKILDGTIINEQIRLERIDLSHISITTDNADNTVQVDVTGWGGITHDTRGNKPFFSAEYGARLPCIKCLFSCIVPEGGWVTQKYTDESGNEVEANVAVGYFCNRGSTGVIAGEMTYSGSTSQGLANVGFENFYDNIIANNNSEIVLREAIARNAGRYGVMARHISRVSARSADITNCADTAAYADRSSMMDVRFADVSGSNNGLQCFNTSNMTAVETIAKNITNIVADSREGSVINCSEMTIDTAKDVFKVLNGGTIIATSTAPTNVSGTLNSKERNTVDVNGVIFA